jgi:hypothetical protein
MIIKAFSEYLKEFDDSLSANHLLVGWLKYKLSKKPENKVDMVINEEIGLVSDENCNVNFAGKSKTGRALLESLYVFADSYEQQKFTRWVHGLKASDFRSY